MSAPAEPPPGGIRFVVLATPRSGSNWLCSLLDSHPAILCHHEIFNPDRVLYAASCRERLDLGTVAERDADPIAFLERMWRHHDRRPVVGFKINRGQDPAIFERVLPDRSIRKVLLRRANRVKTFVSEAIAERTGEWESYPWSKRSPGQATIRIEAADVRRHVERNEHYLGGLRERLCETGQTPFELTYEQIPQPAVRHRLLAFLDAHPLDAELAGLTRKQTATDLRTVIENFDQLAAALEGTPLHDELTAPGL